MNENHRGPSKVMHLAAVASPRRQSTGCAEMSSTATKDRPIIWENEKSKACVLLVEDDPALQCMVLDYFAESSIRTLLASNQREMADQLGSADVDLVILDLRLGPEDGLDLLRKIKSSSELPVIIIT